MKKQWWKLIFALPALALVLYAGGFISQLIRNYKVWQAAGQIGSPTYPSFELSACIDGLFSFPYGLYGVGICLGALAILILYMMYSGDNDGEVMDQERNLSYSNKGTYGTSGFMTDAEMREVLELCDPKKTDGTILGKLNGKAVCLPLKSRMNRNIAVFGASGTMKSRAFARNMIFQTVKRGESLVVTDPKSELYEDMAQYLEDNGYLVKVFNLVSPEHSDSWNFLAETEGEEIMAQTLVDVIIKNTGSLKGDPFWDNSEANLLKALVLYVMREYPEENRNMGEVYKLLTVSSEAGLNKLFSILPIAHPAKAPYNIFKQAAESVRGGIIIGLGSRLQVFQNSLICEMTGSDDIDLELPGHQKCAYFCITSDQDSTFDFLSSLFFSFLFIKLVRYADKHCVGGKLTVPVTFVCDEFPNIGTIPDFCKKISTVRSRGLNISIIFQNLAQLQNRYPQNQWQEILGNCDTQLFLGCTDELTATFISNRTGDVTIGVSSKAKQLGTWRISDYTPEYRKTTSIGKRKLLTPDEVLRLPLEKALVILRGQKVLKVDKFDYTLHPESKKLTPCKAVDHIPAWAHSSEADTREPEPDPTPKPISEAPVKETPPPTPKSHTGNAMPEFEAVDISNLF
ncbi:MAG: type IV secretory system conjugative DNA transfer family protein [Oscillospiraceae bacterium]|nr:type IV secretory system conjugative DNA transfer family protein [Oscillospiraceae bacterium]